MKVLTASLKLSLLFSLLLVSLDAQESDALSTEERSQSQTEAGESLESYLSGLKRQEFAYDYLKVEEESAKLRDLWIQPIRLNYTLTRQDMFNELGAPETQGQNAAITIDQPIFQSGGIFFGVKYANASREFSNYSIDQQKRVLIKQAVELLMQIKQSTLMIQRQQLQIDNSEINLEQKREQYLNGQLDSGFLNNAIIEKNVVTQALYDLETNKERLVSKFESISDLDHREAKIPHLGFLDEQQFLENNIDIDLISSQSERDLYNKHTTLAKYLPKVSLQASYNWQKNESVFFINGAPQNASSPETDYYRYGVNVSMPLDVNSINDYEAARISHLKSLVQIDDKKRELKSLYDQVMQNLTNFDKKILLSQENRDLYATLLAETEELYAAGYKTSYDVATLKNSEKIEVIDKKIYEIDKQLELLGLYEKLTDDV